VVSCGQYVRRAANVCQWPGEKEDGISGGCSDFHIRHVTNVDRQRAKKLKNVIFCKPPTEITVCNSNSALLACRVYGIRRLISKFHVPKASSREHPYLWTIQRQALLGISESWFRTVPYVCPSRPSWHAWERAMPIRLRISEPLFPRGDLNSPGVLFGGVQWCRGAEESRGAVQYWLDWSRQTVRSM